MKLLVVEDDDHVREGLGQMLRTRGHDVMVAGDYAGAAAAIESSRPDLIICDWQLDDDAGDGIDLATRACETSTAKIVMVTARDLEELRDLSAHIPVAAYLRKPIALQNLLDVIDNLR